MNINNDKKNINLNEENFISYEIFKKIKSNVYIDLLFIFLLNQ